MSSENGACDNGEAAEQHCQGGESDPDMPSIRPDPPAPDAVPVPEGPPPVLTAAQRARLHQLLQQRDAEGRVPYGLDDYDTDAAMWAAYRRAQKE